MRANKRNSYLKNIKENVNKIASFESKSVDSVYKNFQVNKPLSDYSYMDIYKLWNDTQMHVHVNDSKIKDFKNAGQD